jgi:hypothetical protein
MCTSNVVTFGMILLLLLLLVFSRSKQVRLNVLKLLALTIILYPTLSPQNFKYIETVIGQLTAPSKPFIAEEKLGKDKDSKKGVNAEQPQRYSLSIHIKDDVFRRLPRELVDLREYSLHVPKPAWSYLTIEPAALRQVFPHWYGVAPEGTLLAHYGKPAKLFAVRQTIGFLNTSPRFWLAGAGMGNFSSKLAIKMTGLRWQGSVPDNKIYIARPFAEYHFYTLTYVFSRDVKEHSVINMPSSTYLQFAGEYGLIGIALWAFFYFGWFWMQSKDFKAGRWLLLACLGLFWLDYWYEMMTLTVIMEFLLLSGIFARKPSDAR